MQMQTDMQTDLRISHIERLVDCIDLPIGRWDPDKRLIFCNRPYLAWAGRSREDLIGRTLAQLYGDAAWAAARDAFTQAFCGATVSYERQITHRGAAPRWARVQVFPDIDPRGAVNAVYTIAFDIDDFIVERQALTDARRRLDRFTENIPYPLTYVDRACVVQFANRAYLAASGLTHEQIVGHHIGAVRGARRWAEHEPFFNRALQGETAQYTRLVDLPAPATARWLRTSYVPDRGEDAGEVVGVYTVTVDVHELTMAQEKLRRSVERDPVTDVLSRRAMMDRIDAAIAPGGMTSAALFFIDMDGFKAVNDAHGHGEGDALLVRVARALQDAVRADDAVGRFGGDEFLVLAQVRDESGASALGAHLLAAVCRAAAQASALSEVTASIGYAIAPGDAPTAMKLLQRADDAMYAAKRLGKNRVVHCGEVPQP
jgi:diguanylate cyclase (GGDEF)-like protein/PAS domain S-box-containing protein